MMLSGGADLQIRLVPRALRNGTVVDVTPTKERESRAELPIRHVVALGALETLRRDI